MQHPSSVDIRFTKALPKIELHAHLSGSISRECLHEMWQQRKNREPEFGLTDPLGVMEVGNGKGKGGWDIESFFRLFSNHIYALLTSLPSIIFSTNSVLQAFADDGVRYLELRTTPRAIPSASVSKDLYVSTILDCVADFNQANKDIMRTYLILSVDRRNTAAEAMDVVELALKYRSRGIVGVDLCGDPAQGDVSIFAPAFAKAKALGLKLTLHFAEIPASATEKELKTLLSDKPDRLGHVIHVPEEVRREIVGRGCGLELCLSCNVHAKMTDGGFGGHHFGYWRTQGCPVILCTDDVGVFCSPLSKEYLLAAQHFDLSRSDVLDLCKRGIDAIFGTADDKVILHKALDTFSASFR